MAKEQVKSPQAAPQKPQEPAPAPEVQLPATTGNGVGEAAQTDTGGNSEGMRSRRAIMLKHFIPSPDWINKNIVAHGKGTKAMIGRIFGVATGVEKKPFTFPDGKVTTTIAVKGVFQTENYMSGEVGEAVICYFPLAYSEKIAATFEQDETIKVVEVDCDVGLEATGKTIPYEWVVVAYLEGQEMATMKRLRQARKRPANAVALLTSRATPAIEGSKAG